MGNKKKIIVLSCMIALLAVTAVFNFVFTSNVYDQDAVATVTSANYFAQYRSERLNTRNEELLQLDNIAVLNISGILTLHWDKPPINASSTVIGSNLLSKHNM